MVPVEQQQRSLAGLLSLLMQDRSAQVKFCHTIMGKDLQAPYHHAFTFAFTYNCIRGAWRGGHHSNPKQGLGSAALSGEQTWKELKCGCPSHVPRKGSGETGIQRCV